MIAGMKGQAIHAGLSRNDGGEVMATVAKSSNRGSKPGERRGGRIAGTPNKLTKSVKEAIEAAFDKVGGADYLARMAEDQPVAFMGLLGKVLPAQINANVTGTEKRTVILQFGVQDEPTEC